MRENSPESIPPRNEANSETPPEIVDSSLTCPAIERRTFLERAGTLAMLGGVAASYGTLGYCALQFLLPNAESNNNLGWQFVAAMKDLEGVNSLTFKAASGVPIVIARQADRANGTGFIALSSVCPHLGCQVFWEAVHSRFFCPCHNGAFDESGKAIAGPPATANQSLKQFAIKIENDLLYILAPLRTVTAENKGSNV